MSFRHVTLGVLPIDERPIDRTHLKGVDFTIDCTWDGKPVDHAPITGHMEWKFEKPASGRPYKRVIKISFQAPFFDDPAEPKEFPGVCNELWNYEVVEFFFANGKDQYLEVEVGPHGHWLCILHNGYRKPFNKGEEIELAVENVIKGDTWHCSFELPLAYLPAKVKKFNAYAIHGSEPNRVYEALYPVTDGTEEKPDFHKLKYFQMIDMRRLIPDGFGSVAFNDPKYGDMWGES